MTKLQILNAGGDCGIDQLGIIGLNLIKFIVGNNIKIKNVLFMTNLQILDVSGRFCGINQSNISCLNLIELNALNNTNIKNVSFMNNLQKLHASGTCGIDQNGILLEHFVSAQEALTKYVV